MDGPSGSSIRALAVVGVVALAAVAGATASCGGGSSASPECSVPGDCTPIAGLICRVVACDAQSRCGTAPSPAGTARPDPTPGDCQKLVCDGAGGTVAADDDTDPPADGTACVLAGCSAGAPTHTPRAPRTSCGGAKLCDGAGACVDCLLPADCGADTTCASRTCSGIGACGTDPTAIGTPCGSGFVCDGAGACAAGCASPADCPGADTECRARTCSSGACGVVDAGAGTALATQVAGDCQKAICDGHGGTTTANLDTDVPSDGTTCAPAGCSGGVPTHTPANARTPCSSGGGTLCDGGGACVECLAGTDCSSGVCSAGHACLAPACDDFVQNGAETDVDCGGPTGPASCPRCGDGKHCGADVDCLSGLSCLAGGGFGTCRDLSNGCTAGNTADRTVDGTVTVTFGAAFAYTPPCIRVRVGTVVTFSGAFGSHPLLGGSVIGGALVPASGGPFVPVTSTETTRDFTMSSAGTFPYYCTAHGGIGMAGAVFVDP